MILWCEGGLASASTDRAEMLNQGHTAVGDGTNKRSVLCTHVCSAVPEQHPNLEEFSAMGIGHSLSTAPGESRLIPGLIPACLLLS